MLYNNGCFSVTNAVNCSALTACLKVVGFADNFLISPQSDGTYEISFDEIIGDLELPLKQVIGFAKSAGITVNGHVNYYGDYEGMYEIINNEISDVDKDTMILRDTSDQDLLYAFLERYRNTSEKVNTISRDEKIKSILTGLKKLPDADIDLFYQFFEKVTANF